MGDRIEGGAAGSVQRRKEIEVNKGLRGQRLVAVFIGGALLFNFPLLALWDHDARVWGLPLFPAALFMLWGCLIALVAWLLEFASD